MTDFGYAPCNDAGVFAIGKLTVRLQCQGCVIARYEAIHGRLCNDMDCHGAGRLAMTDFGPPCNDRLGCDPGAKTVVSRLRAST
jgi:hypothetical protein